MEDSCSMWCSCHKIRTLLLVGLFLLVLPSARSLEKLGRQQGKKVLYIPLDERFTTRDAFLNLAKVTPYTVVTPPTNIISHMKQSANIPLLKKWMDQNIASSDMVIISAELYLYGGLISSRSSNDSTSIIEERLATLIRYKQQLYPSIKMYLAAVVMRIPAYNEDVEEPWYWAYYGYDLFQYSYFIDKYHQLGNVSDLQKAEAFEAKVPQHIVKEFLWRRERNFNITLSMINAQANSNPNSPLFEHIFITQDDNAEYGLNIREAARLKEVVHQYQLDEFVSIYPGADEVGLTMLSRMSVDDQKYSPTFQLVFRDPDTIYYIPNYEGQPMIDTIQDQIEAAGGTIKNSTNDDIYFLVNNFSTKKQQEAPYQPLNRSIDEYDCFLKYLVSNKVIALADVRYSNGADIIFIQWMQYRHQHFGDLNMNNFAYAGWNTDGNTLGTVISNAVLLRLFANEDEKSANRDRLTYKDAITANNYFNSLRILEDCNYQAMLRQELINYVEHVNGDNINDLSNDLDFYTRYVWKKLNSDYQNINSAYGLSFTLDSVYFPWNRTFEIGFNEPSSFYPTASPSLPSSSRSRSSLVVN